MAVINGTGHRDVITGTSADDQIYGRGGNDVLLGDGGNDTIYGGRGDDSLDGQEGSNRLIGNVGNDDFSLRNDGDLGVGGTGDDTFVFTAGKAAGGAGNDSFILGSAPGDADHPFNIMGREVVKDFHPGDLADMVVWHHDADGSWTGVSDAETFKLLDTNGDHAIGAGDQGVTVGADGLHIDMRTSGIGTHEGFDFGDGAATVLFRGVHGIAEHDWILSS